MRFGGENFQLNAITSVIDGAFRVQKNLVLALASLQFDFARRMISFLVGRINFQDRGSGTRTVTRVVATPPLSVEIC